MSAGLRCCTFFARAVFISGRGRAQPLRLEDNNPTLRRVRGCPLRASRLLYPLRVLQGVLRPGMRVAGRDVQL